jgi:hypothetical protein
MAWGRPGLPSAAISSGGDGRRLQARAADAQIADQRMGLLRFAARAAQPAAAPRIPGQLQRGGASGHRALAMAPVSRRKRAERPSTETGSTV